MALKHGDIRSKVQREYLYAGSFLFTFTALLVKSFHENFLENKKCAEYTLVSSILKYRIMCSSHCCYRHKNLEYSNFDSLLDESLC